jgi:hypothetical protein
MSEYFETRIRELEQEVIELQTEVARLKRGDFTPAEFQNLCHNRHEREGCTFEDFCTGCTEYQRRLFGKALVDNTHTFLPRDVE